MLLLGLAVLSFSFGVALTTNTNYTEIVDVKLYPALSFQCVHSLPSSVLSRVSTVLSTPVDDSITCTGEKYINNGMEFYQSKICARISDVYHSSSETQYDNELLEQLVEITQFLNSSCSHILNKNSSSLSGYYTILASNGSLISVYFGMERQCDGKGGWMRVGYINMSEPGNNCPSGLNSYNFANIDYSLCDRPHPSSSGCDSTFFSTFGLRYSQVCGRVRGYQYSGVDGIYQNNGGSSSLEGPYVDGVSITHGTNPRQHIWTFIVGQDENQNAWEDCPCNNGSLETTPQYVGNDYYCESGVPVWSGQSFYSSDPLWDGNQCYYMEYPCCISPNMPWFIKSLNQSTTDDLELRLCSSEGYPNEATPIDLIELYVR